MARFATNALRYRGIGSGIVRILTKDPSIVISNDDDGKEFKVVINRYQKTTQKTTQKMSELQTTILSLLKSDGTISRSELSNRIGNVTEDGIKYHLQKLQKMGVIRREGPNKGGRWIVVG